MSIHYYKQPVELHTHEDNTPQPTMFEKPK